MSTNSLITEVHEYLDDAFAAVEEKGGAVPEVKNLTNLEAAVDSINNIVPPDLSKVLDAEALKNIQNIIVAGKARQYFKLGDEFLISYGSYTMPMRVIGFADATVKKDELETIVSAIQLEMKYTDTNSVNWVISTNLPYSNSDLNSYIEGTVQPKLSAEFLACLGETKVQFWTRSNTTDVSYHKLFAPSMAELGFTELTVVTEQQAAVEGPAFEYYQEATNAKRVKSAINTPSSPESYWARSFSPVLLDYAARVKTDGDSGSSPYSQLRKVVAACNFIGGK